MDNSIIVAIDPGQSGGVAAISRINEHTTYECIAMLKLKRILFILCMV
jgi:hypothetical protein